MGQASNSPLTEPALPLPMVEIDKRYRFDDPNGKVGPLDIFERRRQLLEGQ